MTPEERQMLSGLFDRIRGAANGPKDQEAASFIDDALRSTPSAGYVMAQTVLVQQQALEAAARHISELEAQAKSGGSPPQDGGFLGNLGRSLFGGGQPPAPQRNSYDARAYEQPPQQRSAYAPPPPPQQGAPWGAAPQGGGYAQPPQGGFGQAPQGGGFLRGAMQTATGVAGGVLLGDAIGSLFGGRGGGGGLFGGGLGAGGFGGGVPQETVNNFYGSDPAGQHAEDVLQDQDQDQDDQQDASDSGSDFGGGGDDSWT